MGPWDNKRTGVTGDRMKLCFLGFWRQRLCHPKEGPLRVKHGGDLHSWTGDGWVVVCRWYGLCTSWNYDLLCLVPVVVVKVWFSLYGSSSPLSLCFLASSVLSRHRRPDSFCLELLFPYVDSRDWWWLWPGLFWCQRPPWFCFLELYSLTVIGGLFSLGGC